MKKSLLPVMIFTAALTACNQDMLTTVGPLPSGEKATATLTVSMAPSTKATCDNDGAAANVNRCILEVYQNGMVYRHVETGVDPTTLTATFQVPLVISQKYDFLFWADCAEKDVIGTFTDIHYNTENLKAISIIDPTSGNLDEKDAFFGSEHDVLFTGSTGKDYVLTRPFAQVNIITNDLLEIEAASDAGLSANELWPESISVDYTTVFPTEFNVFDGTASNLQTISRKAESVYGCTEAAAYNTLSMDYFFVNRTDSPDDPEDNFLFTINKAIVTLKNGSTITILDNGKGADFPIKRNFRTNIIGSFLTDPFDFNVSINPEWADPDYNPLPTPPTPSEPQGAYWIDEDNKEAAAAAGAKIVVFPEGTISFNMNPDATEAEYNFDVESVTFPSSVTNFPHFCLGECKYLHEIIIFGGEDCDLVWEANWIYGVDECNAPGRYIPNEEKDPLSITVMNLPKSFTTAQKYFSCESSTPDIYLYLPAGWKDAGFFYKFTHAGGGSRTVYVYENGSQIWPE